MDAVLNWVWQGCLIAVALALALRLLDRSGAGARYGVCWAAMFIVLTLPLHSFVTTLRSAVGTGPVPAAGAIVSVPQEWWSSTMVLLAAWGLWAGVHAIRYARALCTLRRAKRESHAFPASVEASLHHWSQVQARGRRAVLVVSDRVGAAAALGFGSPAIAVAPALVRDLDPGELDRVVVHEWAHVQRRDDLANALQLVVRLIAGWHPAIRWIDRRLQIEREVVCDEMTVAITGSPKAYASCLVKLAPLAGPAALPAPGVTSARLRGRVVRIVSRRELASPSRSRGIAAAAVALLSALSVGIGGVRLVGAGVTLPDAPREPPNGAIRPAVPQEVDRPKPSDDSNRIGSPPAAHVNQAAEAPRVVRVPSDPPSPPSGDVQVADAPGSASPMAPLSSAPIDAAMALAVPPRIEALAIETPAGRRWDAAAETGVAVGRGSKTAGVATAAFFNRFAQRVADAF